MPASSFLWWVTAIGNYDDSTIHKVAAVMLHDLTVNVFPYMARCQNYVPDQNLDVSHISIFRDAMQLEGILAVAFTDHILVEVLGSISENGT